jgi:RNA polymerase sigma-70 factor (ECF subfamily)
MPLRPDMTDRDLLRAYAESSDTDSLGTFFGRHEGSLLRFVAKFLGDADRAQDVVQETFLQVARHPAKLLGVESCHNWLLKVARNIGITHLRRDARQRKHALAAAPIATEGAAERIHERTAVLEKEESRQRVRAAIERLSPRHRELLLLKIEENKSYKEIAEITGLTVTNVGYLLHMAMKELTRRLEPLREDLA